MVCRVGSWECERWEVVVFSFSHSLSLCSLSLSLLSVYGYLPFKDGNRERYELVGVVNSAGSWECGGRAEIGYARIGVPSILNWIYSIVFPD